MRPNQLRSLRCSAHLSQRQLGTLIGVSAPAISQAERGLTELTREHAQRVHEVAERYKELFAMFFDLASEVDVPKENAAKKNFENLKIAGAR